MAYFPMFLDISDRQVLILGGGKVALRKAEKLLAFGPELVVISPEFCSGFEQLAAEHPEEIRLVRRNASAQDVRDRALIDENTDPEINTVGWGFVIAASDDVELNHEAAEVCRELWIPVNTVDDAEYCSFYFPALVTAGDLCVGISTAGASPTAASEIRRQVERMIPSDMAEILSDLREQRAEVKERIPDEKERAAVLRKAYLDRAESGFPEGTVALVGAGCGASDLITVRGLRLLRQCDAVVYDDLIDPGLLTEVRPGTAVYYMGKRSGRLSAPQEEINELLIRLAREGKRVVRLKGGDPYVFGRGAEEMLALREAGIRVQEVPGITSAIAIPAEAGIPVTHRGVSRSVHIVTAHTKDGDLPENLPELAKLGGTLVFLMGLGRVRELCAGLTACGMSADTPAAVVSGGCVEKKIVRATVSTLADASDAAEMKPPAVIVIGETAGMDLRFGGRSDSSMV